MMTIDEAVETLFDVDDLREGIVGMVDEDEENYIRAALERYPEETLKEDFRNEVQSLVEDGADLDEMIKWHQKDQYAYWRLYESDILDGMVSRTTGYL